NGGISASFGVARFAGSSFGRLTADSIKKVQWYFDNPNGDPDSSAFPLAFVKNGAQWEVNDYTYVIDLGDKIKDSTRYVQLKFNGCKPGQSYDFEYKNLESNGFLRKQTITVNRDKNFVYYQFLEHRIVDNEPFNNDQWDILFTTYKESVPDANGVPYPYVIRGVLINPKKVLVAQLDKVDFNAINKAYASAVVYGKKQDEIGYDWKQYDQTAERYTMAPNRVYLLKTPDALIKMKFVDFYDDQGRKGYPKMAWEILQ
ncbi:MAG: HmuY family protein, partial [Bacteroidota bacterium]